MNETTSTGTNCNKWLLLGVFLLLLVQLVTRFAVQPSVGFVLDDWSFWSQAEKFPSAAATLVGGLRNPLRPVYHGIQLFSHRLLGDNPAGFGILCASGYSLALLLLFLLLKELTGKNAAALGGAALFAVLPNLCGHFHWPAVAVGYDWGAQNMALLSAWMLFLHARREKKWAWAVSVLAYLLSIGTYEAGIFLPMAYAVLLWGRGWRQWFVSLLPYGIALGIYAAWRLTLGFGWGWSWFGIPPQTNPSLSLYELKHTFAGIASWWIGLDWWCAVGDGATGFAELPWTLASALVALNAAILGLLGLSLRRLAGGNPRGPSAPTFSAARLSLLGIVWIAATYIPALLGYLVPRLNYLPGAGMALLAALAMGRIHHKYWLPLLSAAVFAGMVIGEGDTKNWADSIRFNRNLYESMQATRTDWENKDVLWIDTRELSQRMTPGILDAGRHHIDTIAEYRNAGLLRGFAPSAMAELILKGEPGPKVILDVEYGAHQEGDTLFWHERYNPDAPRQTPMERVFRIDAFEAGTES